TRFVGLDNYRALFAFTIKELPPRLDEDGEPVLRDGQVQYESWVSVLPRQPQRFRQVFQFSLLGKRYVLGAVSAEFIRAVWDTVVFTVVAVFFETVLGMIRSEEHTSELQSREKLVCRLLLEKTNAN